VASLIDFADQTLLNFRHHDFAPPAHHGYRWIDIKRFRIPDSPTPDECLLSALIGDGQYEDAYLGAGADPGSGTHGPYRLSHLTPTAYRAVDAAAAIGELDAWARRLGSVPPTLANVLAEEVYTPIQRASSRYRLADLTNLAGPTSAAHLGEEARHDLSSIHTEFHEIVIIAPEAAFLTLIVAADD
jgi:hypothetical protein